MLWYLSPSYPFFIVSTLILAILSLEIYFRALKFCWSLIQSRTRGYLSCNLNLALSVCCDFCYDSAFLLFLFTSALTKPSLFFHSLHWVCLLTDRCDSVNELPQRGIKNDPKLWCSRAVPLGALLCLCQSSSALISFIWRFHSHFQQDLNSAAGKAADHNAGEVCVCIFQLFYIYI